MILSKNVLVLFIVPCKFIISISIVDYAPCLASGEYKINWRFMSRIHASVSLLPKKNVCEAENGIQLAGLDTLNAFLPDLIEAKQIHWRQKHCGCFSDKALPTNDDSTFGSLL